HGAHMVQHSLATTWFFFFSSRRRHTRFSRDWSSDVCSSDLPDYVSPTGAFQALTADAVDIPAVGLWNARVSYLRPVSGQFLKSEIGRASCRERVSIPEVAESVNRKTQVRQHRVGSVLPKSSH